MLSREHGAYKYNPAMKRYLFLGLVSVIAFVTLNLVYLALQSPQEKDLGVINECWEQSRGSAITQAQRQVTIGACRALEEVYRLNYGTSLSPGKTDA